MQLNETSYKSWQWHTLLRNPIILRIRNFLTAFIKVRIWWHIERFHAKPHIHILLPKPGSHKKSLSSVCISYFSYVQYMPARIMSPYLTIRTIIDKHHILCSSLYRHNTLKHSDMRTLSLTFKYCPQPLALKRPQSLFFLQQPTYQQNTHQKRA